MTSDSKGVNLQQLIVCQQVWKTCTMSLEASLCLCLYVTVKCLCVLSEAN